MSAPKHLPSSLSGTSSTSSALLSAACRLAAAEREEAAAATIAREDSGLRLLQKIRRIGAADTYELLRETASGPERDAAEDLLLVARTERTRQAMQERQPRPALASVPSTRCTHGFVHPCRGPRCAE